MFIEQFNLYGLLIPFFFFGLSSMILIIRTLYKIPTYFIWHAMATFSAGISLSLLNVIQPQVLTHFAVIPISFLIIAFAMLSHAISLRLQLKDRGLLMLLIISFNAIFYTYFTLIYDSYALSTLIMTIAICLIFGHNIIAVYKKHLVLRLDRWLRTGIILIIALSILRCLYLFFFFDTQNYVFANHAMSASSQFIVLLLMVSVLILLYGGTYHDVIRRLYQERNTDPLTGLMNRRAIFEYLEHMKDASSHQHAVILCDIDHFKHINDTYGHHIGDLALQHVTALLEKKVRYTDRVSRLGGEEFMIILKNTSKETAICIAERLRQSFENTPFTHKDLKLSLTLSFGVSEFENPDNFDQTLQDTDLLLYQAKKLGRNKVEWRLENSL